jgi:23S rRNA G2069 N7-methylase RlmK/C1962 C5-methylase RlmI
LLDPELRTKSFSDVLAWYFLEEFSKSFYFVEKKWNDLDNINLYGGWAVLTFYRLKAEKIVQQVLWRYIGALGEIQDSEITGG